MSKTKYTIEQIEEKCGCKLTYPNQFVEGCVDENRYDELRSFGCSDLWDKDGHWMHRDCWEPRFNSNACEKCNFYPIVKKYNEENKIPKGIETDFIKAFFFTKTNKESEDSLPRL